jgi:glutaredoxin-like YruB-family protein
MQKNNMKKITIYSTPTCHYCQVAKDYFNSKGLKYESIDVQKDLVARKKMIEISEQMGVPVIVIGKKILKGFNEEDVEAALK